ncbi:MAG: adenine deaminase [Bacteroidia bacterium]|nr:MAG: adenine deaminase [Bacteroidia bacterium]
MKIKGKIVDIHNRRIFNGCITVKDGEIISIDEIGEECPLYLLPGFIDAHVHIESSMLTPAGFAAVAVTHGTVAVVCDPHEIANVLGVEGINFMIDNASTVPMDFYFGVPSCVPATSFESNGATVGIKEISELLKRSDIKLLSEMMNFPGVLEGDSEVLEKLGAARLAGKPVDGHAPGLKGEQLKKYIGAGISTDHEATTLEEAREKIKGGMHILIREGSAARNLEALHGLIDEEPDMVMLCCDDIHPEMLMKRHINSIVVRLVEQGHDLYDVLRASSLNPVAHYKLETGLLRVGDKADFIAVDNLIEFNTISTWIEGREVYSGGEIRFDIPTIVPINRFNATPVLRGELMVVRMGTKIRVMELFDGELYTGEIIEECAAGKIVYAQPEKDLLKIVVKERYRDNPPVCGFIKGFGIGRGAFASSVAHDSHNIIAVGVDDDSIAGAINEVIRMKGGLSVYDAGKVDSVSLNIGGIMTDVPCGTIATRYDELTELVKSMGCPLQSPFMTLSFMALLVIPELKIGDRGLFKLSDFSFVELFL